MEIFTVPSSINVEHKMAISFCDQLAKGRVVERFDFEAKGPEFKSLMSSNDNKCEIQQDMTLQKILENIISVISQPVHWVHWVSPILSLL